MLRDEVLQLCNVRAESVVNWYLRQKMRVRLTTNQGTIQAAMSSLVFVFEINTSMIANFIGKAKKRNHYLFGTIVIHLFKSLGRIIMIALRPVVFHCYVAKCST